MSQYKGILSILELIRLLTHLKETPELSSATEIHTASQEDGMHEVVLTCKDNSLCASLKDGLFCRWDWNSKLAKVN